MKFLNLTTGLLAAITLYSTGTFNAVHAADETASFAFPDKWMIRAGVYSVGDSVTQFSVNSDAGGLGTTIDYSKDLGGEEGDTIPRIDAYYRFNERHRIDFTTFVIDRTGARTLAIDPPIVIGDTDISGGEVKSDIKYTLYKIGYAYSFYHSDKVELSISAGLNVTSYDLKFESSGGSVETAGVTAPLPVFGLRMGYAITPKWSVQYVAESFFIDLEDKFRGGLLVHELNTEYRVFKNFALGVGFARQATTAEIDSDDWRGKVTDSYRGLTAFGVLYF